jgi:hypothetical protein
MEIILIVAAVVVIGTIWYVSRKPTVTMHYTKTDSEAPYKVEAPVQESAPAAAPVKEVTTEKAKPTRAKKPAAKPAVKKPAAKKPAAKKPAAKKPKAK